MTIIIHPVDLSVQGEGGVGVSNLLWILVSHLISGVVHRGATGVTPVLLTIVAAVHS